MGTCLSIFHQFMKARNHSNVPFVVTTFYKRGTSNCILHQFMRGKKYSNVPIVTRKETLTQHIAFMRARKYSNAPFVITISQERKH